MALRVVLCGTGHVGAYAARGIVHHPGLVLAGIGTYSPARVGSAVSGMQLVPLQEIFHLPADCVLLAGKAELDPEPTVAFACELLASGRNVVSTALMSLNHPRSMDPEHRSRLETACAAGSSSFHGTGINPGFFADLLSFFLTGLCVGVDSVRSTEVYDYARKDSRSTVVDLCRIGRPLEEKRERMTRHAGVAQAPMYLLADAMGVELDEIRLDYELAAAEQSFDIAATRVEAGTLAGYRRTFTGIVEGAPKIVFDFVHRAAQHVAPQWPAPGDQSGLRWTNLIEGTPRVACSIELSDDEHGALPGSAATAARAVNSIPALCAASPGTKTALDLAMFGGRLRSSRV